MFARKSLTGLVAGGVAASVVALTAGAASAAYTADPDDVAPNSAADLVGVGSDTSQVVIKNAAVAYNATNPAVKIATYAATGGGTITPPGGSEINRPNGSGAGKSTLYGSGNNAGIDFARSSSAQSSDETNANLFSVPFALDTLGTVTARSTNAPASLTVAQLVDIYKGNTTNWSQIGGGNGAIVPLLPQAGSGTRSFFLAQLKAANGGTDVALGAGVGTFQENDDAQIKSNPNAVAPFSTGRAAILDTLRTEGGFSANRALYNVFRQADLSAAGVPAFFGPSGYLCSASATRVIEDAGFRQLATEAKGGVCGTTTQAATTNFTTNELQSTATTLSATSPSANAVRLTAAVTSSSSPQGTVSFFEGATTLATGVQLVSGQAVYNLTTTPGAHSYTARFVPAGGSVYRRSSATSAVNVVAAAAAKGTSTLSAKFAKPTTKTKKGKSFVKPVRGTVTVVPAGTTARPTGTILVKRGPKPVGSGSLINGVASIAINGLKPGRNNVLTATWGGDANITGNVVKFTVKTAKGKTTKKK